MVFTRIKHKSFGVGNTVVKARVKCPYCGARVFTELKPNSEYTARCYLANNCGKLFAIKTNALSVITAKIDWDKGIAETASIAIQAEKDFSKTTA